MANELLGLPMKTRAPTALSRYPTKHQRDRLKSGLIGSNGDLLKSISWGGVVFKSGWLTAERTNAYLKAANGFGNDRATGIFALDRDRIFDQYDSHQSFHHLNGFEIGNFIIFKVCPIEFEHFWQRC